MRRLLSFILLSAILAIPAAAQAGQPYLVSESAAGNIWRIEDANGDGDALDVGERTLWATGGDAHGGMQTVGRAVYAVEVELLSGNSEIVRLIDFNGDGDALDIGERTVWADGFAQPIDVVRDASGSFYVCDDADGEVWQLSDTNGDGDALDVGERTLFADGLDLPAMLLPWESGLLAADYFGNEVVHFNDLNGDGDALDVAEKTTVVSAVGFPTGLHSDGSSGLYVTSINGDTVYRATDNNDDGDFLDVAEVLSYADGVFGSIDAPWNMTDYASGGILLADYGGSEVAWARDANGDGDALDIGEVVTFADGIDAPVDIVALVEGLFGDYNGDGKVSAADYTIWQDTYGSTTDLRADGSSSIYGVPDGLVDDFDYQFWKDNYGNTLGSGSGSGSGSAVASVPEPAALWLFILAVAVLAVRRRPVA